MYKTEQKISTCATNDAGCVNLRIGPAPRCTLLECVWEGLRVLLIVIKDLLHMHGGKLPSFPNWSRPAHQHVSVSLMISMISPIWKLGSSLLRGVKVAAWTPAVVGTPVNILRSNGFYVRSAMDVLDGNQAQERTAKISLVLLFGI